MRHLQHSILRIANVHAWDSVPSLKYILLTSSTWLLFTMPARLGPSCIVSETLQNAHEGSGYLYQGELLTYANVETALAGEMGG